MKQFIPTQKVNLNAKQSVDLLLNELTAKIVSDFPKNWDKMENADKKKKSECKFESPCTKLSTKTTKYFRLYFFKLKCNGHFDKARTVKVK